MYTGLTQLNIVLLDIIGNIVGRAKEYIMYYVHTITITLLVCVVLLVDCLCNRESEYYTERANDSGYIPKSKRGRYVPMTARVWGRVLSGLRQLASSTFSKLEKIEQSTKRKRIRVDNNKKLNKINSAIILRSPKKRSLKLLVMSVLAMQVKPDKLDNTVVFDTDSGSVGIDNRCSACLSHDEGDFVGPLKDCNRSIKGFGGTKFFKVKTGTLLWKWADDYGEIHRFLIPNSYCVPEGGVRLLSPQHWAKTQKDSKPFKGTGCETNESTMTLYWNQKKNKLTVPLGKTDNVATFRCSWI